MELIRNGHQRHTTACSQEMLYFVDGRLRLMKVYNLNLIWFHIVWIWKCNFGPHLLPDLTAVSWEWWSHTTCYLAAGVCHWSSSVVSSWRMSELNLDQYVWISLFTYCIFLSACQGTCRVCLNIFSCLYTIHKQKFTEYFGVLVLPTIFTLISSSLLTPH